MPSGVEVGEKIAAELGRLAREARDARLDMLAYLIEMARLEATQHGGRQIVQRGQ